MLCCSRAIQVVGHYRKLYKLSSFANDARHMIMHAVVMAAMDAVGTPKQRSKFQVHLNEGYHKASTFQFWRCVVLLMVLGSTTGMWMLLTRMGARECISNQPQGPFPATGGSDKILVQEENFSIGSNEILVKEDNFSIGSNESLVKEEDFSGGPQCDGRRVYVHELPAQFNSEIVDKFCSEELNFLYKCESYIKEGFGGTIENYMEPVKNWYRTEHYSLEPIVHERLKHYRCRTKNPAIADHFYLPYYIGLDLKQHLHHDRMQARDFLVERFIGWLLGQPSWTKAQGHNHFMVLGRPVWDFSRRVDDTGWGSSLLAAPEVWNLTKLLVERDPNSPDPRQIGIPYPTSLHPTSDSDIAVWRTKVAESKRDLLVAFTGSPRNATLQPQTAVRHVLFEQCTESDRCRTLLCNQVDCRKNPHLITDFFLSAKFCLQPPGDSATRKAVFDCLVAGGIPVLFTPDTAYTQYPWHLPEDGASYSVFIDQVELMANPFSVVDHLAQIPESRIKQMQTVIQALLPSILYDDPGRDPNKKTLDALDITLEHIFDPTFRLSTPSENS